MLVDFFPTEIHSVIFEFHFRGNPRFRNKFQALTNYTTMLRFFFMSKLFPPPPFNPILRVSTIPSSGTHQHPPHLLPHVLAKASGHAPQRHVGVVAGDEVQRLLQRCSLLVLLHGDGRGLRLCVLGVAGVHHNLNLGMGHCRQHQLADLQHCVVRHPGRGSWIDGVSRQGNYSEQKNLSLFWGGGWRGGRSLKLGKVI